jgi:hypothetical protein
MISAVALPIPLAAAVMSATRSVNRMSAPPAGTLASAGLLDTPRLLPYSCALQNCYP